MHEVNENEVVAYSKKEMFELVADVGRYQEFLPWCVGSRVLSRENNTVVAELRAKLGPVAIFFTTLNKFHPYESIDIQLAEGPFEVFEGGWRFSPESEGGSKIEFRLRFKIAHEHLGAIFDPLFQEATDKIVGAFKKRAQSIYDKE